VSKRLGCGFCTQKFWVGHKIGWLLKEMVAAFRAFLPELINNGMLPNVDITPPKKRKP